MTMLGIGLGFGSAGRAVSSVYDPTSLALSAYWRADFAATWAGTPSAGNSGGRDLTTVLPDSTPSPGTAQNGKAPADLDGVDDQMRIALALSSLINANAGSVWILARADAAAAAAAVGSPYNNPGLLTLAGSGYFGIGYADSGVCAYLHDGSDYRERTVAAAVGAYFLAQVKLDGASLKLRVNGGARSEVAAGSVGDLTTNPILVGANIAQSAFFNGQILEIGVAPLVLSDTIEDNVLSYARATYALSLT